MLRAGGAPDKEIARWQSAVKPFEVWESCWPAVELFINCATQMRYAGMAGVPTGLDYTAVEAFVRLSKMEWSPQILADLQIVEGAAISELIKRQKKK